MTHQSQKRFVEAFLFGVLPHDSLAVRREKIKRAKKESKQIESLLAKERRGEAY